MPSIEPQPGFPAVDLEKPNDEVLTLMLANEAAVRASHAYADGANWSFRVGHPAIATTMSGMFDKQGSIVAAVEHSIMVFEAMTVAVRGSRAECFSGEDSGRVNRNALRLVVAPPEDVHAHTDRVLGEFMTAMPRAAGVIAEASERFVGQDNTRYALAGAALERNIIFDYGRLGR